MQEAENHYDSVFMPLIIHSSRQQQWKSRNHFIAYILPGTQSYCGLFRYLTTIQCSDVGRDGDQYSIIKRDYTGQSQQILRYSKKTPGEERTLSRVKSD